jgi:hypothetical protein
VATQANRHQAQPGTGEGRERDGANEREGRPEEELLRELAHNRLQQEERHREGVAALGKGQPSELRRATRAFVAGAELCARQRLLIACAGTRRTADAASFAETEGGTWTREAAFRRFASQSLLRLHAGSEAVREAALSVEAARRSGSGACGSGPS